MVPQFRPQAALHMLQKLINYEDLSPLLPSNKTLTELDDNSFYDAMNKWTESARTHPYVTAKPGATTSGPSAETVTAAIGELFSTKK